MPTAAEMPALETLITEDAPSPGNPLGVKGVGEAGINAAGATIAAAVDDAIGRPGAVTRLPITPDRLHAILNEHPPTANHSIRGFSIDRGQTLRNGHRDHWVGWCRHRSGNRGTRRWSECDRIRNGVRARGRGHCFWRWMSDRRLAIAKGERHTRHAGLGVRRLGQVGWSVRGRGLGPILHRALAARSVSLGRRPWREMGRTEVSGRQLGRALDRAGADGPRIDDPSYRGVSNQGWRDRSRHGNHPDPVRRRPGYRRQRDQHQNRRECEGYLPDAPGVHRWVQLQFGHDPRGQARPQEPDNTGGIRTRINRIRSRSCPPGGWLPHTHGPHLVLCVRHPGL